MFHALNHKATLQDHTTVMCLQVVASATYMRTNKQNLYVEKSLSFCVSYRLFVTCLPKRTPASESQAAPAGDW